MEVLYEDNHLLIVNKKAGYLSQSDDTERPSVEGWAEEWLKEKYSKSGNVYVKAVHRLDRSVSGALLLAKTSKALKRLNASFREKKCIKKYFALVEGEIPDQGVFKDYLLHGDYKAHVVSSKEVNGKYAELHYKVMTRNEGISLVKVDLLTGRYHQIRIQFSSRNYYIIGDFHYGSRKKFKGIGLHHHLLSVPHPTLSKEIIVEAPLPECWNQLF